MKPDNVVSLKAAKKAKSTIEEVKAGLGGQATKLIPKTRSIPKIKTEQVATTPLVTATTSAYYGLGTYERTDEKISPIQRTNNIQSVSIVQNEIQNNQLKLSGQNSLKVDSAERFVVDTTQIESQRPKVIQQEKQDIILRQSQEVLTKKISSNTARTITKPINPTVIKPYVPFRVRERIEPEKKPKTSKAKFMDKIQKAFDVVTYRKGKEEVLGENLPIGRATKLGVSKVLSTLRASFKLKPSGTTVAEDIDYKVPVNLFKKSKYDPERYVQLKTTRFGARSETKEAQFFRKQKARKMKWF